MERPTSSNQTTAPTPSSINYSYYYMFTSYACSWSVLVDLWVSISYLVLIFTLFFWKRYHLFCVQINMTLFIRLCTCVNGSLMLAMCVCFSIFSTFIDLLSTFLSSSLPLIMYDFPILLPLSFLSLASLFCRVFLCLVNTQDVMCFSLC